MSARGPVRPERLAAGQIWQLADGTTCLLEGTLIPRGEEDFEINFFTRILITVLPDYVQSLQGAPQALPVGLVTFIIHETLAGAQYLGSIDEWPKRYFPKKRVLTAIRAMRPGYLPKYSVPESEWTEAIQIAEQSGYHVFMGAHETLETAAQLGLARPRSPYWDRLLVRVGRNSRYDADHLRRWLMSWNGDVPRVGARKPKETHGS